MGRDVDHGWAWVVMFACLGNLIVLGILVFSAGIIYLVLLDAFDGDPIKTAWIGSMSGSLSALLGPVAGLITANVSCRTSIIMGGFLCFIGFSSCAFVDSINMLFLTFGAIGGTGLGLMYTPCMVVLGYYFDIKRDLACGVAVAGTAIGSMIGPVVINSLNAAYGWRGLFLMIGAISFHIVLFGALSKPSSVELQQKDLHESLEESTCQDKVSVSCMSHMKVLLNPGLFFMNVSVFLWSLSCSAVILHLPKYAIYLGADKDELAILMTVFGAGSILSRILAGLAASMGETYKYMLYFGSFGIMSFIVMFFPIFAGASSGRLAFTLIFGFYTSVAYAVLNPITVELVGLQDLAIAFGVEQCVCGIGFLIGPPIAALILEETGSYASSFAFSGIMMLSSSIFGMTMVLCKRPVKTIAVQMMIKPNTLRSLSSLPGVPFTSMESVTHLRSYMSLKMKEDKNHPELVIHITPLKTCDDEISEPGDSMLPHSNNIL